MKVLRPQRRGFSAWLAMFMAVVFSTFVLALILRKPPAEERRAEIALQRAPPEAAAAPPPPEEDGRITFFTSTASLKNPQVIAVRSWLAINADVLIIVDDPLSEAETAAFHRALRVADSLRRVRIVQTPYPRGQSNAPRLDLILNMGESLARTNWVCLINADIVLPEAFEGLPRRFQREDWMVMGSRHDCRMRPDLTEIPDDLINFEDLERYSMAPCWPHGVGGKDYFLYKKGYFERVTRTPVPPFWIGKFLWDHWIVNATWEHAVDATPSIVIGHMSHNHFWTEKQPNRAKIQKSADHDIQENYDLVMPFCESKVVSYCLRRQSVYDVKYKLCPNGEVLPVGSKKLYEKAVAKYRGLVKERRAFEGVAFNGTSPKWWTRELEAGEWSTDHGCPA